MEKEEVLKLTEFLNNSYVKVPMSQRLWHIKNDTMYIMLCPVCGKTPIRFDPVKYKYNVTCSNNCGKISIGLKAKSNYKERSQSAKITCLKLYGVDNPSKNSDVKIKNSKKVRDAYNDPSRNIKSIIAKTNILKYKFKSSFQNDTVKERFKQNFLKNHGVNNPMKIMGNRRFGDLNYSKTDDFKKYMNDFFKEKFIKKLPKDYEVIQFGESIKLVHKFCNNTFTINRMMFYQRKYKYHTEICVHCNPRYGCNSSKGEKDIFKFIKSIYNGVILKNDRKIIKPYELDIFLPDLNIAFEFNGTFYHADPRDKRFNDCYFNKKLQLTAKEIWDRDKMKIDMCSKSGIKLMVIWEMDWNKNKNLIKKKIVELLAETWRKGTL